MDKPTKQDLINLRRSRPTGEQIGRIMFMNDWLLTTGREGFLDKKERSSLLSTLRSDRELTAYYNYMELFNAVIVLLQEARISALEAEVFMFYMITTLDSYSLKVKGSELARSAELQLKRNQVIVSWAEKKSQLDSEDFGRLIEEYRSQEKPEIQLKSQDKAELTKHNQHFEIITGGATSRARSFLIYCKVLGEVSTLKDIDFLDDIRAWRGELQTILDLTNSFIEAFKEWDKVGLAEIIPFKSLEDTMLRESAYKPLRERLSGFLGPKWWGVEALDGLG